MSKFKISILLCAIFIPNHLWADSTGDTLSDIYGVYETVEQFCGEISDRISQISGVAKVNTGVTAVGAVAAGGALYAGVKKSKTDAEIEELAKNLCDVGGCDPNTVESMSDEEFFNTVLPVFVELIAQQEQDKAAQLLSGKAELDAHVAESKQLGNWRSGLLLGSTGTNIASAIISGLNKDQSDLIQQITACNAATVRLRNAYNDAINQGINPIENPVMKTFENAFNNCGTLNTDDVAKIEKRMSVVMGTSIAGSIVGAVGSGTSIAANTDKIRNDNSEAGKQKEKTLNTVSNIASGTNVATGLVGTGFNISLITLTKKLIQTAQQCEDAL